MYSSYVITLSLPQASGTWDGRTLLWDLTRGKVIKEWQSHQERVWALSMDDYHVVSAGLDARVCVRSFLPEDLRFNRWQRDDGAEGAAAGAGQEPAEGTVGTTAGVTA